MHQSISRHRLGVNPPFFQWLAKSLMRLIGWRLEGIHLLTEPQYVLVVAPHTSNWDLVVGLICAHAAGLFNGWKVGFLIKAEAIRWPLVGPLLHFLGGIGIQRQAAQDVVHQVVEVFRRRHHLLLAITPEGTRSRRDFWKTGFYRIALDAHVPLALAFLDYERRAAGILRIVSPSGDLEGDFQVFREAYAGVSGKHPGRFGAINFKP